MVVTRPGRYARISIGATLDLKSQNGTAKSGNGGLRGPALIVELIGGRLDGSEYPIGAENYVIPEILKVPGYGPLAMISEEEKSAIPMNDKAEKRFLWYRYEKRKGNRVFYRYFDKQPQT